MYFPLCLRMRDLWEMFKQGILAHPVLKMNMPFRSCGVSGNSSEIVTCLVDGGDKPWTLIVPVLHELLLNYEWTIRMTSTFCAALNAEIIEVVFDITF